MRVSGRPCGLRSTLAARRRRHKIENPNANTSVNAMKLQHLRFFVSVVDCGGVVKAAERLRVSQPAISAALKSLEQELGRPLFEPSVRGKSVRPTPRALAFYDDAREILRSCEVAHAKFRQKDAPSAKLRIGVLQTIS